MFLKLSVTSLCGAILSVTLAAVAVVAMLPTSFASSKLEPALRLGGLFS
jgi:hypothetical protein